MEKDPAVGKLFNSIARVYDMNGKVDQPRPLIDQMRKHNILSEAEIAKTLGVEQKDLQKAMKSAPARKVAKLCSMALERR